MVKNINSNYSKRANKSQSIKKITPLEYMKDRNNCFLLDKISGLNISLPQIIFSLAINLLIKNKLAEYKNGEIISDNPYLVDILKNYSDSKPEKEILNIKLPDNERDILGIVYQSVLSEGTKNIKGSYYTPNQLIKENLSLLTENSTFLDPCCGAGSFLIEAAKIIKNPQNLYGYDTDKNACFIAKINLILRYKDIKFNPNIFNEDFLLKDEPTKYNMIATNPPWGSEIKNEYKKLFPEITSGESFSYFIYKCQKSVKKDGSLCFILPESILNVKCHQDIRRFILENLTIEKIDLKGKIFTGVLSDVIVLTLKNSQSDGIVKIVCKNKQYSLKQSFYNKNINNNFSILNDKDIKLLDKIYSVKHLTLDDKSDWALGIVTGNNKKYITSQKTQTNEKIYSGKNIVKGKILPSDKYITYDRKAFQQVAPDKIYRAKEKLVYKFISKKLVFAHDTKQRLFLNSVNILIPKLKGYSIQNAMALLNSSVFQYIYKKTINELKVLRSNLSCLPFPDRDLSKYGELTDADIFEIFNLTNDEIEYIKQEIK